MSATEAWVDHWQRVGPILEKIRREELRNLSDDGASHAFRSLADYLDAVSLRELRNDTGFVEQQKLFAKLRKP